MQSNLAIVDRFSWNWLNHGQPLTDKLLFNGHFYGGYHINIHFESISLQEASIDSIDSTNK